MDFFLEGVDDYSPVAKGDKDIFLHAVQEVTQYLNMFDVKKHKRALCGGSGHNFDRCPKFTQNDLKGTYICLCLLVDKLLTDLRKLYPTSKDHNDIQSTSISTINLALANK